MKLMPRDYDLFNIIFSRCLKILNDLCLPKDYEIIFLTAQRDFYVTKIINCIQKMYRPSIIIIGIERINSPGSTMNGTHY